MVITTDHVIEHLSKAKSWRTIVINVLNINGNTVIETTYGYSCTLFIYVTRGSGSTGDMALLLLLKWIALLAWRYYVITQLDLTTPITGLGYFYIILMFHLIS